MRFCVAQVFALATAGLLLQPIHGQSLVRDLFTGGGGNVSSSPAGLIELNGAVLFSADSGHGRELWRSVGGNQGAQLLLDIEPGSGSSDPEAFVRIGSRVFFTAQQPETGREIWVTDGTAQGTRIVTDLVPGSGSPSVREFTAFNGELYFTAQLAATGRELWKTDGTAGGTSLVADLVAGGVSSAPRELTVFNGALWFAASIGGAGVELCRSDGTAAGTQLFLDIWPGVRTSDVQVLRAAGTQLFFFADDGAGNGRELWSSNGTVTGTLQVADINPGRGTSVGGSGLQEMVALDHRVVFLANDGVHNSEPWVSDGTMAGTQLLSDTAAGFASSFGRRFTKVGGGLVLFVSIGQGGYEAWRTDGTPGGTFLLKDVWVGGNSADPYGFTALPASLPGVAVFTARNNTNGVEAYVTDGSTAGTRLLSDHIIGPNSSSAGGFCVLGNSVMCSAFTTQVGVELWQSNPQLTAWGLVDDIATQPPGSAPEDFVRTPHGVLFGALGSNRVRRLWVSDGSASGTTELPGVERPRFLTEWNGRVVAQASGPQTSASLLVTDGTPSGTTFISAARSPSGFRASQGLMFFSASTRTSGAEPFVTDGTPGGTQMLEINPGGFQGLPSGFTPAGTKTVFRGTRFDTGAELFVSDGTAAGTQLLYEFQASTSSGSPGGFVAQAGLAWFAATTGSGRELWVTDGTAAGTREVVDLAPGNASSSPDQIVPLGSDRVCFVARIGGLGRELFVSDGTASGTRLIGEVVVGSSGGDIQDVVSAGSLVFFTADDGVHGRELWVTDGAAVRLVRDLLPGRASGTVASTLRAVPGVPAVVFAGSDGEDGIQLFVSDGTSARTRKAGHIGPWPGAGAARIGEFAVLGNALWFACDEGLAGVEPWRIAIAGPASVATYGRGCAGSTSQIPAIGAIGLPRIGDPTFAVELTRAKAQTSCVLNVSLGPIDLPVGGCRLLVDLPVIALTTRQTDILGRAVEPLPVPPNSDLQGLVLYGQWVVLDPGGALLGLGALSDGLQMLVGY